MKKHPAKFNDKFIPIMAEMCRGYERIFDPFAGTGKICELWDYGYGGEIYCNDIEPDWMVQSKYTPTVMTIMDAEVIDYPCKYFDAIVTSPTYGNRMADHHVAKDGSKRMTYTHCLGRSLDMENTGRMQWGGQYRDKHKRIYKHIVPMIKDGGAFIINLKNHIRKGAVIDVVSWHIEALSECGLLLVEDISIDVESLKFGANADKRINTEHIIKMIKSKA